MKKLPKRYKSWTNFANNIPKNIPLTQDICVTENNGVSEEFINRGVADSFIKKTENFTKKYFTQAEIYRNAFLELKSKQDAQRIEKEVVKMKFIDAPVGARFKFINHENKSIWVKVNSFPKSRFHDGDGLIVKWNGNVDAHQGFCSFVHEEIGIDFDTVVELV